MKILILVVISLFITLDLGSSHFDISDYRHMTVDYKIDLIKDVATHYKQHFELIKYIFDVSGQYNLDPLLLIALIQIESNFIANAVSKSNAVGYCQIKHIVIEDIKQNLNRYNHEENIMIGAIFLSKLINIYGGDIKRALIHYNAGTLYRLEAKGIKYADDVTREYEKISLLRERYNFSYPL